MSGLGEWLSIAGSPARFAYERIERDGVAVLRVALSGHAENTPDGVARVRRAVDELGATITPEVHVATLDVRDFANAADDASSILTGVLAGVPCCWITDEWDAQDDGSRWDLPPSVRLASTDEDALARVLEWRAAGGYRVTFGGGSVVMEWRFTERGLVERETRDGTLQSEDVWHRNRLVQRSLLELGQIVFWPFPDARGKEHQALRHGARLVLEGDAVIEADFDPWQTLRPLPASWVESIEELPHLRILGLRGTTPREEDLVRAVRALPVLETLRTESELRAPLLEELRRHRPSLLVL